MTEILYGYSIKENSLIDKKETLIYNDTIYRILICSKEIKDLGKYKQIFKNKDIYTLLKYEKNGKSIKALDIIEKIKSEQEYQRIAQKRESKSEKVKEETIQLLVEEGINNGLEMMIYGGRNLRDKIGLGRIHNLLKKTLNNRDINGEDMKQITKILGWNIQEEMKQKLNEEASITNQFDLLKFGINPFLERFGGRYIGIFYKKEKRYNKENLMKFGEALGRDLKQEIIDYLDKKGIKNGLDLMRINKEILNEIKAYIGILVNKTLNNICLEDKTVLVKELGRDIPQEIVDIIKASSPKTKILKKLNLGKNTLPTLSYYEKEIEKKLGYKLSEKLANNIEDKIYIKRKVISEEDYLNIPQKELRSLGIQNIGFILGRTIKDVTAQEKRELGIKLGYSI